MYAQSEIASLVQTLPVDLLLRSARVNAKFDAICDVEDSLGHSKTLDMMQESLFMEFGTLYSEALTMLPAAISEEEPTADGEYVNQGSLEFYLRRL